MRILALILALLALSTAGASTAPAGYVVDQRSDETTGNGFALWNNITVYAPMGQTFLPSYHLPGNDHQMLTGIEVYMTPSINPTGASSFSMSVCRGGPSGATVAETQFGVAASATGWVFVPFASVQLVPNELYAFLIRPQQDPFGWGLVSDGGGHISYPSGCWVLWGAEQGQRVLGNDLAFRTYAQVPEPSSLLALLTAVGGMGGLMWRRRR